MFRSCTNLTDVTWGVNVVEIQAYAFQGCSKLNLSVAISDSNIEIIRTYAFQDTAITSVIIPYTCYMVGKLAFDTPNIYSVSFENTSGWYLADNSEGGPSDIIIERHPGLNNIYYSDQPTVLSRQTLILTNSTKMQII